MLALMDKTIVRIPVYIGVGIFFVFVSMGLTFPDDEIKEILIVQAEEQLGGEYRVRITELDIWWFTGVTLEGVSIEERVDPNDEPAETDEEGLPADLPMKVRLTEVSARLAILSSLFNFAPVVEFEADVGGGVVEGDVVIGSSEHEVSVEVDALDLRQTSALLALTGIPFFGELNADMNFVIDAKTRVPTDGSIKLSGNQLTLGPATVRTDKFPPLTFFEVPQTNFGTLDIDMQVKTQKPRGAKLDIATFTTSGRDVRTEAWGDVELSTRFERHRPNVELRLQFDEGFVKKNSLAPLLNVKQFRRGQNKDWYGFVLYGTLGKIQFKGSTQAAQGPGNAEDGEPEGESKEEKK